MEEILAKIIEIEHQAQDLVDQGIEQKEVMKKEVDKKIEVLKSEIYEMSEHKIEQLKSKNEKEVNEKLSRIGQMTQSRLKALEQSFQQNKDKWENEIFNRIIGR